MKQSKKNKRKGAREMKDKIEALMDKKVMVELKAREIYLLSIVA